MMLFRLLEDVLPDNYCLISASWPERLDEEVFSRRLPGKYFYVSSGELMKRRTGFDLPILREGVNTLSGAYVRARQIARIIRDQGCEAVLSCSGGADLLDVPSGFLASRLTGVPFYVYLFDTYSHMWIPPRVRAIGKRLERVILRRARGIIVTNELVRELLRDLYGVESIVIHNPCDLTAYEYPLVDELVNRNGDFSIVYTGTVYQAHYDAFRNLVAAIEKLGRRNIKLHLYTNADQSTLTKEGIRGPVVLHEHQSLFAMPVVQRKADILFLPLAFDSPYPELIKVSSPAKTGEFLAARRPVLVHAPSGSFLSLYFRRHDCGVVVDQNDPAVLAQALERLIDDPSLQQRIISNAWDRAVADFSLSQARARFSQLMKMDLIASAL